MLDALLACTGDISLADDDEGPPAVAASKPAAGAVGKKRQSAADLSEESDSRPASKRPKSEELNPAPQPVAVPKVPMLIWSS